MFIAIVVGGIFAIKMWWKKITAFFRGLFVRERGFKMIKCPECSRMISDKAEQCPKCGIKLTNEIILEAKIKAKKKSKKNTIFITVGCLTPIIIFLILIIAISSSTDSSSSNDISKDTSNSIENNSVEYNLALIDSDGYITKDDAKVYEINRLLKQLELKYNENKNEIGDITAKAYSMLEKEKMNTSILEILNGMNKVIMDYNSNQKYSEIMVAYFLLRQSAYSHNDAIEGLKALNDAFYE